MPKEGLKAGNRLKKTEYEFSFFQKGRKLLKANGRANPGEKLKPNPPTNQPTKKKCNKKTANKPLKHSFHPKFCQKIIAMEVQVT